MQGQELRDEIAMMIKALRKAGHKNSQIARHKYYSVYKCDNGQNALAWIIHNHYVTVKELKAFLKEVPDDLVVNLEDNNAYDNCGGTYLSFLSLEKVQDESWYNTVNTFYKRLLAKQKQQEKELQLEPIRKKVLNKEKLTEKEMDFLFNK